MSTACSSLRPSLMASSVSSGIRRPSSSVRSAPLAFTGRARHHVVLSRRPLRESSRPLLCRAERGDDGSSRNTEEWTEKQRRMEDELKDPRTPFEYLLPRPLRLAVLGGSAASCFIACLLGAARLASEPSLAMVDGGARNLGINFLGLALSAGLFVRENSSAEKRIERRKEIRDAQIEFGDRKVFVNESGQKMSILKEVDDDWILRRLERWGSRDFLPLVGPKKGAILQSIIREKDPKNVVEVGSFLGYSAILIARVLSSDAKLITIENDLKFVLSTKRFLWQASQGQVNKTREEPLGRKVKVKWGRAQDQLPKLEGGIDFLFLDGRPKEYLEYLQAAEPKLSPGATIVADNAGVFAEGGLKPYLEYVRTSPLYRTRFIESTLEWRDDVPDGLEVSEFLGEGGAAQSGTANAVAGRGADEQ